MQYDPAIILLDIYPREIKTAKKSDTNSYSRFSHNHSKLETTWSCNSGGWMQDGILLGKTKEWTIDPSKNTDESKGKTGGERNQTQKATYCVISLPPPSGKGKPNGQRAV